MAQMPEIALCGCVSVPTIPPLWNNNFGKLLKRSVFLHNVMMIQPLWWKQRFLMRKLPCQDIYKCVVGVPGCTAVEVGVHKQQNMTVGTALSSAKSRRTQIWCSFVSQ